MNEPRKTWREQVSGLRDTLEIPKAPRLKNLLQLAVDAGNGGSDPDAVFVETRRLILDWIYSKYRYFGSGRLPQGAYEGNEFSIDLPGHKFEAAQVNQPVDQVSQLWAARVEHPDQTVSGALSRRVWSVEFQLGRLLPARVIFGARVSCFTSPEDPIPIALPRVVSDVARKVGLAHCDRRLDGSSWQIRSTGELRELRSLLASARRTIPLILVSARPERDGQAPLIDPGDLARRSIGLCFVAEIPHELTFDWSDLVGREWSVFQGAIRTYGPGLDFSEDEPASHPFATADKISSWRFREETGAAAFAEFLLAEACKISVTQGDWRERFVPISDVKLLSLAGERQRLEEARGNRGEFEARAALLEREREALTKALDEAKADAREFNDLADQYRRERDSARSELFGVRTENDALRQSLVAQGKSPDANVAIPNDLKGLDEWVKRYLAGRLLLHPRALRGAKDSVYEDPRLIYQGLLFLASQYRDSRLGYYRGDETDLNAELAALGLQKEFSISKERVGENKEQYFVTYPLGSSQKRLLDLHLTKGASREARYCLRIYFFWDESEQAVVVGWLPSHLETRAS